MRPEKRTIGEWALLIGLPLVLAIAGGGVIFLLVHSRPPVAVGPRDSATSPALPPFAVQPSAGPPPSAPAQPTTAAPAPMQTAASATAPPAPPFSQTAGASAGAPVPSKEGKPAASVPSAVASAPAPVGSAIWEGFRGPGRMNISPERLARQFPAGGPRRLWQISLGEGHAGPAVYKGRVYVLDYEDKTRQDLLRCFDLNTGKELWRQGYPVMIKRNHGYSRTVPAVNGRYVVTIGPMGDVMCCEAQTGRLIWRKDLVAEYGAVIPEWYTGQCPLIEDNKAIVAPGGKALMLAIDLPTGKIVWQTPNTLGWRMTHSSIMPVSYAGKRIYVYPASGGVIGVNAANGQLLWSTPEWTVNTANIPTPVPLGQGRIFVCGGYNSGAAILQMGPDGKSVRLVKRIRPNVFQAHQQTPILYQGYLYGIRIPGDLVCLDLEGNVRWSSGPTARFGLGPYVMAQGVLYVLSENGELTIVEANPTAYKPLAKAKVLSGPNAWAPMAIADGKLLCRDAYTLVCLDMRS